MSRRKTRLFRDERGRFVSEYNFAILWERGFVSRKNANFQIRNKRHFIEEVIRNYEIRRDQKRLKRQTNRRKREKTTGHKLETPKEEVEVVEVGPRGAQKQTFLEQPKEWETYVRYGYAARDNSRVINGRGAALIPGKVSFEDALSLTRPEPFWPNWEQDKVFIEVNGLFLSDDSGIEFHWQYRDRWGFAHVDPHSRKVLGPYELMEP